MSRRIQGLMPFVLVSSTDFSCEHRRVLLGMVRSFGQISTHTGMVCGVKDVESRHLAATDAFARLVGLTRGGEVARRLDGDMPCAGTAEFAEHYRREDLRLLHGSDLDGRVSVLNVHRYASGTAAFVFEKPLLKHRPTCEVPGTVYCAYPADVSHFLRFFPASLGPCATGCPMRCTPAAPSLHGVALSEYEHLVCFLLANGWSFAETAEFMNRAQPGRTRRSADTIHKCKNRICERLGRNSDSRGFRRFLADAGLAGAAPRPLFELLLGSRTLPDCTKRQR